MATHARSESEWPIGYLRSSSDFLLSCLRARLGTELEASHSHPPVPTVRIDLECLAAYRTAATVVVSHRFELVLQEPANSSLGGYRASACASNDIDASDEVVDYSTRELQNSFVLTVLSGRQLSVSSAEAPRSSR